MKKITLPIAMVFAITIFACMIPGSAQTSKMDMNEKIVFKSKSANDLKTSLRKLWEDHGIYTRNVILNIIDDLPGTNEAVTRLLQNQDDIGNAIKPIYGDAAGKKLSELLREHIMIAADLLRAAKINDQAAFATANSKWTKNADEIASFLNTANPTNWKSEEMKNMMHEHLDLTTQEAVARVKKDYKADIAAFDKTRAELLEMSDMLAVGIVAQFPDKFKN